MAATTYYTFHVVHPEWEQVLDISRDLYTSFGDACTALDQLIQEYVDHYNNELRPEGGQKVFFHPPHHADIYGYFLYQGRKEVLYQWLNTDKRRLFFLRKMTVKQ